MNSGWAARWTKRGAPWGCWVDAQGSMCPREPRVRPGSTPQPKARALPRHRPTTAAGPCFPSPGQRPELRTFPGRLPTGLSPGWSRNFEASIEFYPRTNGDLEVKGPSQARNSRAQLRGRIRSPLCAAPSSTRRPLDCRVLEAGQGHLQRAGTAGLHKCGAGVAQDLGQLLREGGPGLEDSAERPQELGTQLEIRPGRKRPVLPTHTRRVAGSQSTQCDGQAPCCVLSRVLRPSEALPGQKTVHQQPAAGPKPRVQVQTCPWSHGPEGTYLVLLFPGSRLVLNHQCT